MYLSVYPLRSSWSIRRGTDLSTVACPWQPPLLPSSSATPSRPFLSPPFSPSLLVVRVFFCPLVSTSLLPWCHLRFLFSTRALCISISWSLCSLRSSVCLFFLSVVDCWSYSASIFAVTSSGTCSGMPHTSWCPHRYHPTLRPVHQHRLDVAVKDLHFSLQAVDARLPYLVQRKEGNSGFLQPGFDALQAPPSFVTFDPRYVNSGTSSRSFPSFFTGLSTLTFNLMVFVFPTLIFKPAFSAHSLMAVVLSWRPLNLLESRACRQQSLGLRVCTWTSILILCSFPLHCSSWPNPTPEEKVRSIHHFKSDFINSIDHMRISGTEASSVILN